MRWINRVFLSTPVKIIVVTICFIAFFVLAGLYSDNQIVDYRPEPNSEQLGTGGIKFTRTFLRYDSGHYRSIVENGYTATTSAFFPLYPLSVASISKLDIPVDYSLFVVSWFFCITSAVVLFYWLRFELKKMKSAMSPWRIMFLIAIFPTSFYLMLGYSESLFIFLTIGSLFAYRRQNYWLAGILGAFATATRVQGGVLAIFFLVDYLLAKDWRNWRKLISVVLTPVGLGLFMFFLWQQFGNPFEFIIAQKSWGRLNGDIVSNLISSFTPLYLWYMSLLGLMLYAVYKKLGKIWFLYCLAFMLIPLSSGRLDSVNRYMLALPPMFLALALWLEKKPEFAKTAYVIISVLLLTLNVLFFTNGYWVG